MSYLQNFCPSRTLLAGMTTEQLQAALASAQAAYIQFQTGGRPVTVSYSQGDGAQSVTFSQTNIAALSALIASLQAQLGLTSGRRPLRFRFS